MTMGFLSGEMDPSGPVRAGGGGVPPWLGSIGGLAGRMAGGTMAPTQQPGWMRQGGYGGGFGGGANFFQQVASMANQPGPDSIQTIASRPMNNTDDYPVYNNGPTPTGTGRINQTPEQRAAADAAAGNWYRSQYGIPGAGQTADPRQAHIYNIMRNMNAGGAQMDRFGGALPVYAQQNTLQQRNAQFNQVPRGEVYEGRGTQVYADRQRQAAYDASPQWLRNIYDSAGGRWVSNFIDDLTGSNATRR